MAAQNAVCQEPSHLEANIGDITRIAFGSCLQQRRPHSILQAIVDFDPDLFIFTGDNIYADTRVPAYMEEEYRRLEVSELYQLLEASCPVVATWDDHDYGENDAGADYPMKEASEQLFEAFWGLESSPASEREGVYQSYLLDSPGRRVQIILLDTRFFRSPLDRNTGVISVEPYEPSLEDSSTILGPGQWSWLSEQLAQPAELRLVVSSVQVLAEFHGWESWSNFPQERERLLELIRERRAEGLIFISGDRHFAEISRIDREGMYPLYDITSSGLNRSYPAPLPTDNNNRVGGYYLNHNYGVIEIDWSKSVPTIRMSINDTLGNQIIEISEDLNTLRYP